MKMIRNFAVNTTILWLLFVAVPFGYSQESIGPYSEIFGKVKDSAFLLDDGQSTAYGIYLASLRNGKALYFLSSDQLSIGIEKRIRVTFLNGKAKQLKAEKIDSEPLLGIAIYKIEYSSKELTPITRVPQDSVRTNDIIWSLGPLTNTNDLTNFRVANISSTTELIELSGDFLDSLPCRPFFDSKGRIVGCVTDIGSSGTQTQLPPHEIRSVTSISALLEYAVSALKGVDLYPIWKETYPTQFTIEQIKESVTLLDTKKSGAGIFLGWSKSKTDTSKIGYVLTAFHVVSDETSPFSVQFAEKIESKILGETVPASIDRELDLAIVRIVNCPAITPVKFIRNDDLQKLESIFAQQQIASIGYGASVAWRYTFGNLTKVASQMLETNLNLDTGDSGGPVFNERGEVLGLNRETTKSGGVVSISTSSEAILKYLDDKLGKVEFEEKWGFYHYPSFWDKNRLWLIVTGTAAGGGLAAALMMKPKTETPPPEPITGHPIFP